MADEKDFLAEYSKSGRAGCKACKMNIAKDVLRLAIMVQSPHFDGKQPNWYHFECFWLRAKATDISQFSGIDNLRWDDQKKIKDRLDGKGPSAGATTPSSKKSKNVSNDEGDKDFWTEYAKTGKSKCRGCEDLIPKSEVRIAKKDYTSQRAKMYGPQDLWHHVDCFIKIRDELEFGTDKDITKIGSFPCLLPDDKKMLQDKFGKPTAPKRKATSASDGKPAKSAKIEETPEDKEMKKQNEMYWKCRDTLEKLIHKDAMKGLLEYNNQEVPSGDQKLLNYLADCMTFGALKKCPECEGGQLVFSSGGYICHGNLTEWTKCQYTTRTPKRGTFKVPEEYHDVSYLKKYKCSIQVRLFPKEGAAATSAAAALNETKKVANKDKPLQDMKFAIIGKVGDKKKITKEITNLGGAVVTKIDSAVAACFSTKEEVDADSKKMKEARGLNIRVLGEAFLEEVKGGDLQELLKKHSLSYWGEFTKPVPTKSIPQMKSAARDAAMFTKSVPSTMKMTVKGGSAVDPDSGLQQGYHVLKEGKDLYSEVLNMVDVMKGTNSYYKLQVLESDSSKSSYHVFRSWGRVGTTIGGTKIEKFYDKEGAKENFKFLYAEKTLNEWTARAHFKKHPHKFYPMEMDYGQDDDKIASLNEAGAKSKLPKPIQEIIKMIFDVESMKKAMVEFEIDLKKMPLGKLSKKQMEKAYSVLTEVQNLLKNGGSSTKFLDCSNRFYTLIPHDFGMEKPPIIDNEDILKTKVGMLDSLLEIEVAYSLMKSTDESDKDPIDRHYEQLKTEIEVLDKKCDEYQRLVEYVENTHGVTHDFKMEVEDIFTIKREKEAARYKPFRKLHNRRLLWHGSRTTNYAGILSQGLRIAPPEAPVTGYMFGKGVYFADMASKSANYCRTTRSNPTGFMLLCEVALGNMYEKQQAEMITKLADGFHSTKGLGRTEPDPSADYVADSGVIYPMGKGANTGPSSTSLLYSEYIVYDTAQINMKYMLKMKIKPAY